MNREQLGADGIFRTSLEVCEDAIDENGHVNNVVYVQWMQDVAIRHSLASGGTAAMKEEGGSWVVRSHSIEYLRPAFAGDVIDVSTWIANIRRVRSLRKYEFVRRSDGELLARGETDWVFVDPGTGRPSQVPDSVAVCFRVVER